MVTVWIWNTVTLRCSLVRSKVARVIFRRWRHNGRMLAGISMQPRRLTQREDHDLRAFAYLAEGIIGVIVLLGLAALIITHLLD